MNNNATTFNNNNINHQIHTNIVIVEEGVEDVLHHGLL